MNQSSNKDLFEYSIAILAGGKAKRFGSNKSLFVLNGKAIIIWIFIEISKLPFPPKQIIISLNTPDQLALLIETLSKEFLVQKVENTIFQLNNIAESMIITIPLRIVFDDSIKFSVNRPLGPILGLKSIFFSILKGFVQILPCDMPYFDSKCLQLMQEICQENNNSLDAIVPIWENGFIEPLVSLYRVEAFLDLISNNIQNQIFRLRDLFTSQLNIKHIKIEKVFIQNDRTIKVFQNLNEKI